MARSQISAIFFKIGRRIMENLPFFSHGAHRWRNTPECPLIPKPGAIKTITSSIFHRSNTFKSQEGRQFQFKDLDPFHPVCTTAPMLF